jgi:hypothetical protein
MGWVYIDPIPKLAIIICIGVALSLRPAALPQCITAVKIHGTTIVLKNNTGHLTENAITFYFELRFQ